MKTVRSVYKLWWLVAMCAMLTVMVVPAAPALAEVDGPRPDHWTIRFTGVIDAVPAKAGDPWMVAGQTVAVNADTRVKGGSQAAAGMWAEVAATRQADNSLLATDILVLPPDVRLKGPLQDKPTSGSVGDWKVAGQTISVTADTYIGDLGGPIAIGDWVEVVARQQDSTLVARMIRHCDTMPAVEVAGAIQAMNSNDTPRTWQLSGISLVISDTTEISGTAKIGLIATAWASLGGQANNVLTAQRIKVSWFQRPSNPLPTADLTGTVQSLPPRMLYGVWSVENQMVAVTPLTHVDQTAGPVNIDAVVHVVGYQIDTNKIWATAVTVISSPGPIGQPIRFMGLIKALPASGLVGTWTIGEHQVQVTAATHIEGARYAQVGAIAVVNAVSGADNAITVLQMWIIPKIGPHPRPPQG